MNEKTPPTDNDAKGQAATEAPNGENAVGALAEAERQRDDYYNQLQRTRAEFLNYQKRARAQADTDRTYAVVPLALDLIAVLDNFERAQEAARNAGLPSLVEGIEMVGKQLAATLEKHNIKPIHALGQPFDPSVHEALSQQVSSEHPEGTVVAELGKGYRLLDRVLRPAKVAVSVRPPAHQANDQGNNEP
jgi:molecular chaperone GrpE